jgi:putative ABC transport system permease protein
MFLKIAFRNVLVHWRQSLAAVLSIAGAFFCFVLFQGYIYNVNTLYVKASRSRLMYGDVLFENKNFTKLEGRRDPAKYSLHKNDQDILRDLFKNHEGEIEQTTRHLYFQGVITTGHASKIFIGRASNLEEGAAMRSQWRWNALYGKPLYESANPHPILLGQNLALQLGCEPDRKINSILPGGGYVAEARPFHCLREDVQLSLNTASGHLNAMDFTVSGIVDGFYRDLDSRYIEVPLEVAQQLLDSDDISFWAVKLKDSVDINRWIQNINTELEAKAPSLHALSWMQHPVGDLYRKSMSLLSIFGNFVSIVVAFISILSVMNTMFKIVSERTREIGTLLSLGFHRRQIVIMFLQEAFFLGLLGTFLGAVAAVLATLLVNGLNITYKAGLFSDAVPFRIRLSLPIFAISMFVLVSVTILTCYFASRSTVQKKIVECLGHV